jgi:phenylacetate-CoA ligase
MTESDDDAVGSAGPEGLDSDAELRWTVQHAYHGSPFFQSKLDSAGIDPDDIGSVADLARLPLTTKQELRESYPFGWTAVPIDDVVRIHSSSGTTGRRTLCTYTAHDIDAWSDMFIRCYRYAGVTATDRIQIAVGYGLWTAGVGFQLGAERLGAMTVPSGPGNTELQLELMRDLGSTVLGATASFALLLGEEAAKRQAVDELALRVGIFGSERWGEAMRRRIDEQLGIESFDIYGLTELWGPGTGIECSRHDGIHVWSDNFLVEIIDPDTLERLGPGEQGEIVLTTFGKEATPLLRYRTRDLSNLILEPCPCGSPYPRIGRLTGRSDDMVKVRGVMLYPAQMDIAIDSAEGVSCEYQLHISRDARGHDEIVLRVEGDPRPAVGEALATALKRLVGLRIDVEIVTPGSLPRSERKARRLFDHRAE